VGRARVPARREGVLEANGVFSVLERGRLWASVTTDREDPTSPNALEEKATRRKAMSDRQRSLPALDPAVAGSLPRIVKSRYRLGKFIPHDGAAVALVFYHDQPAPIPALVELPRGLQGRTNIQSTMD
jgi:hypothetical protein